MVTPDPTLTTISIHYQQSADGFVADGVFPPVPVAIQHGKYPVFDRGDFNRVVMKPRGPNAPSAGGGYTLSRDEYGCEVQAVHIPVSDQVRANDFESTDAMTGAAEWVARQGLLRKEPSPPPWQLL